MSHNKEAFFSETDSFFSENDLNSNFNDENAPHNVWADTSLSASIGEMGFSDTGERDGV